MEFRSYNASLINDDDLVGVPLPDATRTKLEDLSSPESIWDAEVVFIDEISRTRPELQNKLFPIIYDRRVQRHPLTRARMTESRFFLARTTRRARRCRRR